MTCRGRDNGANLMESRKPTWWPWPAAHPGRARPLDVAIACRRSCEAGVDRLHLPGDGQAGAEKNELKPWRKKEWCIPKVSAEFVACMEGRAGPLRGTL